LAVQTLWPGQLSHRIDNSRKEFEAIYVRKKYRKGIRALLLLLRGVAASPGQR
jgi:hypothetical protein